MNVVCFWPEEPPLKPGVLVGGVAGVGLMRRSESLWTSLEVHLVRICDGVVAGEV